MLLKSVFPFVVSNTGARGTLDFPKISLLELMIERKNIISMDVAVKFIKLAFTFEEWGLFESAAGQLSSFFQVTYTKPWFVFVC